MAGNALSIQQALTKMNPQQRIAAEHVNGPLLIMAGAGSGKTRVLTHRVANLIATHHVAPWSILAITFTNKAAREMQTRIQALVGPGGGDIWVSTFHSMCVRMLRKDAERIGISSNFTILDATDQLTVVKQCMRELNLDTKKYEPKAIQGMISAAKNECIEQHQYAAMAGSDFFKQIVAKVYTLYEQKCARHDSLDFDSLMLTTLKLWREEPEVLAFYQKKFQYIHVDEYQDTNKAQYTLTKLLASQHRNLCVVGDSDQSIYKWRGADMTNILNFERDYSDAKVVMLEQNYRSTKKILMAANHVIGNNRSRKAKNLWTDNSDGDKIHVYYGDSDDDESYYVARAIRTLTERGGRYREHAILYRTNAQSRKMEEVLIKSDIPYKIVGGVKFYERKEIKDMLSYLRLIANPNDDTSLLRILNVPKRGIGDATEEKLLLWANQQNISIFELIEQPEMLELTGRGASTLRTFREMIDQLRQMMDFLSVTELVEQMLQKTGIQDEFRRENTIEAQSRLENIDEFLSVTQEFERKNEEKTLVAFLTDLALVSDLDSLAETPDGQPADQPIDAVTLMTMHSSKGLEYLNVYIIGMEEGIFPHSRALAEPEEMEEERRLAYVGITRAEQVLHLTCAAVRMQFGRTMSNMPSRFLGEIDESLLDKHTSRSSRQFENAPRMRGKSDQATGLFGSPKSDSPVSTARSAGLFGGPLPIYGGAQKSSASSTPANATPKPTDLRVGDKVSHAKWGIGTIVSLRGEGDDQELQIAFPAPTGLKKLLAKFAPITKV